jgi:hypothetical protein
MVYVYLSFFVVIFATKCCFYPSIQEIHMFIAKNKQLELIMLACIVMAQTMVGGCTDEQSTKRSIEQSWHRKFNWRAEDFFTDLKVIELCRAIEKEDLILIDKLIAEGTDVNAKGKDNMTPLLWAYPKNNYWRVKSKN